MRLLILLALVVAAAVPGATSAATPSDGTVTPGAATATWTGGPFVTSKYERRHNESRSKGT